MGYFYVKSLFEKKSKGEFIDYIASLSDDAFDNVYLDSCDDEDERCWEVLADAKVLRMHGKLRFRPSKPNPPTREEIIASLEDIEQDDDVNRIKNKVRDILGSRGIEFKDEIARIFGLNYEYRWTREHTRKLSSGYFTSVIGHYKFVAVKK